MLYLLKWLKSSECENRIYLKKKQKIRELNINLSAVVPCYIAHFYNYEWVAFYSCLPKKKKGQISCNLMSLSITKVFLSFIIQRLFLKKYFYSVENLTIPDTFTDSVLHVKTWNTQAWLLNMIAIEEHFKFWINTMLQFEW